MSKLDSIRITTSSAEQTERLGALLSSYVSGGDVVELIGDIGAGKTQLVRGLAAGINSSTPVQSPSFMLQRVYEGQPYTIHHYDFYRLEQPGVMLDELRESLDDPDVVVAIEWARSSKEILPENTVTVTIESPAETERAITIEGLDNAQELANDFDN